MNVENQDLNENMTEKNPGIMVFAILVTGKQTAALTNCSLHELVKIEAGVSNIQF